MNKKKDTLSCASKNCPLAMVYSPFQEWESTYDAMLALERGTIFPELDKPFLMGSVS